MWLSDRIDPDPINRMKLNLNSIYYGASAGLQPEYPAPRNMFRNAYEPVPVVDLEVKKIIKNGPATIVFWTDGTKTIVKLQDGDQDDIYAAFTAALAKKIFGSTSKVKKIMKKALKESEGK